VHLHLGAPWHFSLQHLFGKVDARSSYFRWRPLSHVGVDDRQLLKVACQVEHLLINLSDFGESFDKTVTGREGQIEV
jgi:hypothetical protein